MNMENMSSSSVINVQPQSRQVHLNPKFSTRSNGLQCIVSEIVSKRNDNVAHSVHLNPNFNHSRNNSASAIRKLNPKVPTVHVNPNFMSKCGTRRGVDDLGVSIHVNPKFMATATKIGSSIHINPQILHQKTAWFQKSCSSIALQPNAQHAQPNAQSSHVALQASVNMNTKSVKSSDSSSTNNDNEYSILNTRKLVKKNIVKPSTSKVNIQPNVLRQKSVYSSKSNNYNNSRLLSYNNLRFNRTRNDYQYIKSKTRVGESLSNSVPSSFMHKVICSKYKIVKNVSVTSSNKSKTLHLDGIVGDVQSKYKIDRRTNKTPKTRKRIKICSPRHDNERQRWNKKLSLICKPNSKLTTKGLVRIGGVLYKSSRTKLTLSEAAKPSTFTKVPPQKREQVVYVRGHKFVLDASGKTMRRISAATMPSRAPVTRVDIGGITFVQKSQDVLIRTNTHHARTLLSQAKQRSINLLTSKMKKNNRPCLFYRRFGQCSRHSKGTCPLLHDPNNIAVCKKFLQGNCDQAECKLSHKAVPEKMATCRFFLEGVCIRDDCPYPHVKVNPRAPLCCKFLQGYCSDGHKCKKRHILVCPELELQGHCPRGKCCPFPHKSGQKCERRAVKQSDAQHDKDPGPLEEAKRYYLGEGLTKDDPIPDQKSELEGQQPNEEDVKLPTTKEDESRRKRPNLGILPAYIPL